MQTEPNLLVLSPLFSLQHCIISLKKIFYYFLHLFDFFLISIWDHFLSLTSDHLLFLIASILTNSKLSSNVPFTLKYWMLIFLKFLSSAIVLLILTYHPVVISITHMILTSMLGKRLTFESEILHYYI